MPQPNATENDWSPDILIYTDAAVSDDGTTSIAYTLETEDGEVIREESQTLDEHKPTHIAEYIAVLRAVAEAHEVGYEDPVIYTDYEGVVDHVFGDASPDDEICDTIREKLVTLLRTKFNRWMLEWLPREHNETAHELANEAAAVTG